ncbi:MAG: hypothetical protein ACK4SZ_16245 [Allosphingosinicella sp.]|uniref:hypothetical protein n=1 Tax=Allosphingosinicella sp. TaxID=2823234 RepID=UPI003961CC50
MTIGWDPELELGFANSVTRTIGGLRIEVVAGNLVDQPDLDAIVGLADVEDGRAQSLLLQTPQAGLEKPLAFRSLLMPDGMRPRRWVIYSYQAEVPQDQADHVIAACYSSALQLVEQSGAMSVGLAAPPPGALGRSIRAAALAVMEAIRQEAPFLVNLRLVRLVLPTMEAYDAYGKVLVEAAPADVEERTLH